MKQQGRAVSKKRTDFRWEAPDGTIWASEFEYTVFKLLERSTEFDSHKCGESDSVMYSTKIRHGICMDCGSSQVTQQRIYTPDICLVGSNGKRLYLETKGYFRRDKRALFREAVKQTKGSVDIRVLLQSNFKATPQKRIKEYLEYYKIPVAMYDKNTGIPKEWMQELTT